MKKTLLSITVLLAINFVACTEQNKPEEQAQSTNPVTKTSKPMNNLVSIVEIPITDYSRAIKFYQNILNVTIENMEMAGTQMGVVPSDSGTVNLVLVKGADYIPTASGAVIYLNTGNDLQPTLDKVEKNGGKVIVPKTQISPEMGYFALFTDTEGNKLGLHSSN